MPKGNGNRSHTPKRNGVLRFWALTARIFFTVYILAWALFSFAGLQWLPIFPGADDLGNFTLRLAIGLWLLGSLIIAAVATNTKRPEPVEGEKT